MGEFKNFKLINNEELKLHTKINIKDVNYTNKEK